jgi:hypothetical protein
MGHPGGRRCRTVTMSSRPALHNGVRTDARTPAAQAFVPERPAVRFSAAARYGASRASEEAGSCHA